MEAAINFNSSLIRYLALLRLNKIYFNRSSNKFYFHPYQKEVRLFKRKKMFNPTEIIENTKRGVDHVLEKSFSHKVHSEMIKNSNKFNSNESLIIWNSSLNISIYRASQRLIQISKKQVDSVKKDSWLLMRKKSTRRVFFCL